MTNVMATGKKRRKSVELGPTARDGHLDVEGHLKMNLRLQYIGDMGDTGDKVHLKEEQDKN